MDALAELRRPQASLLGAAGLMPTPALRGPGSATIGRVSAAPYSQFAGISNQKVEPRSGLLFAPMRPPCSSIMRLQIASP